MIHKILIGMFCLSLLTAGLSITSGPGGIPSQGIVMKRTAGCPSGYSEVTTMQGRYPVGTPASGTVGATAGTALSNTENRATGGHTHTFDLGTATGGAATGDQSNGTVATSLTTGTAGSVAGTNGPYMQVLFCRNP